jgi:hypothetical protein
MLRFLLGSKSIGFLTLHETENDGYLGSFLITDFKGIPIEFRCTHSIKPDAVQRTLYGEALLSHIGVELCGRPLISSAKNKPRLTLVDKPFLLKLNGHSSCPVMFVKELGEEEDSTTSENFGSEYQVEVIEPRYDRLKPLEIAMKADVKSETKELVGKLHSEFNVVEPFDRMGRAVEILIRRSSRFK